MTKLSLFLAMTNIFSMMLVLLNGLRIIMLVHFVRSQLMRILYNSKEDR